MIDRQAPNGDIVKALKNWAMADALPLWATRGWDAKDGSFVEKLLQDGMPDRDAPRRVRVQARQIYCFATAARLGWYPKGRTLAQDALERLLARAKSPDGRPGFIHCLTPNGEVIDARRDLYDHAFVLLALASVFALGHDAQVRGEIDALLAFLDTEMKSPHGGYHESVPVTLPRRQNPHMHLFEALIACFDATKDLAFQARAGDLFALFMANFYDAKSRIIGEYFEEDWSAIPPIQVEPGHLAEWVWLLNGFERITGCPTSRHRDALVQSAMRYRDATSGCFADEGDRDGAVTRATRRLWPQTEFAKAWMAQAEAGIAGADDEARAALVRVEAQYLRHPVRGGWHEHLDEQGRSLVNFIPASSLYHVLCAIFEADRVLE